MDETEQQDDSTVGERLREARVAQKMSLETVAGQTRIPLRHLEALENGDWATLPAPAYCVGFAKNYATMVGLDPVVIGADLRAEMGGTRQVYTQAEVFEPADPKRAMPKWLMLAAAIAVVLIVALLMWLRNADLAPADAAPLAATADAAQSAAGSVAAPANAVAATPAIGPVTISAREDAWIKVRDAGGAVLREGVLKKGESFAVPTAPGAKLDTGRPEALSLTAGGRDLPAVGTPGRSVSGISLDAADLSRGPNAVAAVPASGTTAAPAVPTNGASSAPASALPQ